MKQLHIAVFGSILSIVILVIAGAFLYSSEVVFSEQIQSQKTAFNNAVSTENSIVNTLISFSSKSATSTYSIALNSIQLDHDKSMNVFKAQIEAAESLRLERWRFLAIVLVSFLIASAGIVMSLCTILFVAMKSTAVAEPQPSKKAKTVKKVGSDHHESAGSK